METGGKNLAVADARLLAGRIDNYEQVLHDAQARDEKEHLMSVRDAFAKHRKAAIWSALLSCCLIMEGFDLVCIGSFYGQTQFQEKFGSVDPATGKNIITAAWQSGLSNGALVGEILGVGINGYCTDKFGYKRTILGSLVAMTCFIFIPVFAVNLPMLEVGEILQGIPWGIFQVLTTAYAADVCPINLRAYLTAWINMCWGIGLFLASGVVRATLNINGEWAWRLPYTLQWVWPPILFAVVAFCPESPYWLVRHGRYEEAQETCKRLANSEYTDDDAKKQVAYMIYTTALEANETEGSSYLDCFRGAVNLRRTEIVCAVYVIQWWSGNPLISYATVFFEAAGLDETRAFDLNLATYAMFLAGTICSWTYIHKVGRRTIYMWGLAGQAAAMLICGILGFIHSQSAQWGIGSMLIVLNFFYNLTVGPLCYVIISETHSTRLRSKSIVLARNAYNITGFLTNSITPRMISSASWNWGAKSGLFYFGTAVLSIVWCWFRLPETKGRSYSELDVLFQQRVPAWRFSKTVVEQFGDSMLEAEKDPARKPDVEHVESPFPEKHAG